ncbi:hypothetical protein EVG20_g2583 [Dentipellis fragilis]|uniref:Uncharacterized protein n=1 Tax=Dentipellis fragilis TaxID=205917 RepID=A0A4Y9Z8H5_9AGAM|nr:hypothetical protein EVG20_g2583 [Dentipellis fragilis]
MSLLHKHDLMKLSRHEIQQLAEKHGLKPTMKSVRIVNTIMNMHPGGLPVRDGRIPGFYPGEWPESPISMMKARRRSARKMKSRKSETMTTQERQENGVGSGSSENGGSGKGKVTKTSSLMATT